MKGVSVTMLYRRLIYNIPRERADFRRDWWRISDAARSWGVGWATAKDYFRRFPTQLGVKRVMLVYGDHKQRFVLAVLPGTPKPHGLARGNARFRDSDFQSEMANRRWRGRAPESAPVEP